MTRYGVGNGIAQDVRPIIPRRRMSLTSERSKLWPLTVPVARARGWLAALETRYPLPASLLRRLQLAMLAVAIVVASVTGWFIVTSTDSPLWLPLMASSGLAAVAALWCWSWVRNALPWPLLVVESAVLLVVGTLAGVAFVIVLFAGLMFRALSGHGRTTLAVVVAYGLVYLGAFVVAVNQGLAVFTQREALELPALGIVAGSLSLLATSMRQQEVTATREGELHRAGAAIAAALDADAIAAAVLGACRRLITEPVPLATVLWLSDGPQQELHRHDGAPPGTDLGLSAALDHLPEEVLAAAQAKQTLTQTPAGVCCYWQPLRRGQQLLGVLALAAPRALAPESARGMRALASLGSLALERLALSIEAQDSRLKALVQYTSDLIVITDRQGIIRYASPAHLPVLGLDPASTVGTRVLDLLVPDDRVRVEAIWGTFIAHDGAIQQLDCRVHHRDGGIRTLEIVAENLLNDPSVFGIVLTSRDVTERVRASDALKESEERYSSLFEKNQAVMLLIEDGSGRIVGANPTACAYYGYSYASLTGMTVFDLTAGSALRTTMDLTRGGAVLQDRAVHQHQLASGQVREVEVFTSHISVHGSVLIHAIIHDITERSILERRLAHQAFHDPLTDLPNRLLFADRVAHAISRHNRLFRFIAVLFIDLDRFKSVNDSLGHQAGDALLVAVARRFQDCLRSADTLARLGGDEFAVLLEDLVSPTEAVRVAGRLLEACNQFITVADTDVAITASIGIVATNSTESTAEILLRDADIAMYQAKAQGKARYVVFDASMQSEALSRLQIEHDLRGAIANNQLRMFYQPKVNLVTGQVIAVEALVRWRHPTLGLISPTTFIPVAEETGLIHAVGRWVITEACRQLREWELHWPITRDLSMGVNLSVRQFQHPDLLEEIARALQDAGLAPSRLILEVTETVLIDGYHVNAVTLNHIKDLGVRIAIDDFGTGYSSLSYLKQLPVDMLKIDQAFVRGLGTSSQDGAIISAVVSLAHTLGLKVTAEGIETHAQLEYVQDLGCEVGQGFLFTPPMPASALGPVLFGPEATPFSARPDLALSFTQRRQRGVA